MDDNGDAILKKILGRERALLEMKLLKTTFEANQAYM